MRVCSPLIKSSKLRQPSWFLDASTHQAFSLVLRHIILVSLQAPFFPTYCQSEMVLPFSGHFVTYQRGVCGEEGF